MKRKASVINMAQYDTDSAADELERFLKSRDIEVMKIRRFYDRLKEVDDDPDDDHIDEDFKQKHIKGAKQ